MLHKQRAVHQKSIEGREPASRLIPVRCGIARSLDYKTSRRRFTCILAFCTGSYAPPSRFAVTALIRVRFPCMAGLDRGPHGRLSRSGTVRCSAMHATVAASYQPPVTLARGWSRALLDEWLGEAATVTLPCRSVVIPWCGRLSVTVESRRLVVLGLSDRFVRLCRGAPLPVGPCDPPVPGVCQLREVEPVRASTFSTYPWISHFRSRPAAFM